MPYGKHRSIRNRYTETSFPLQKGDTILTVTFRLYDDGVGFRYSVNIQYKRDADEWMKEIHAYQIYYTGIEAEFGDEFITLTTCDHSRRDDGRFVVVARRIREGETIV